MNERVKQAAAEYRTIAALAAAGIPIGVAVGAICALFGRVLLAITDFRSAHPWQLIPFLALAGVVIAWTYQRFGKNTGRGMGLVFDVGHGAEPEIPLRLVPLIMGGTWLTHLFGGSAGREGVAVQIGATLSHWVGRKLPIRDAGNALLVCGMAAGFAGLFRTPLAACVFALEVLVAGRLEYRALACSLTASFAASMTSGALGLEKFAVPIADALAITPASLVHLAVAGVVFGLVGGAFAWCLAAAKRQAARIDNPFVRIAIIGVALSIVLLALWQGRYAGLGTNLISAALAGEGGSDIYTWDWACKFVLTVVTLAAGFQGGEVTPLFSIGASLGIVLAGMLGLPVELVAALGYAAVFGSATNTLLAPILIGGEVFGFANLPAFFVVCAVSYLVNGNQSIYGGQKLA